MHENFQNWLLEQWFSDQMKFSTETNSDFLLFLLRERSSEVKKFFLISFFVSLLFLRTLLKSSGFSRFNPISSQIQCFTSKMWYDNLLFRNFIRFLDFFQIFPDFLQIFRFLQFWPYFLTELMFNSQIWHNNLLLRNFIRFPDFFRIFSGFSGFKDFLMETKVYYPHEVGL